MAERRTLTEGLKETPEPLDPGVIREFVYGGKAKATTQTQTPAIDRVPISTRMRGDLAKALKKASLERQLQGVEPNTLQDILEEAVEPWLKSNGYIT
jgi:hypothetical protein